MNSKDPKRNPKLSQSPHLEALLADSYARIIALPDEDAAVVASQLGIALLATSAPKFTPKSSKVSNSLKVLGVINNQLDQAMLDRMAATYLSPGGPRPNPTDPNVCSNCPFKASKAD